jgi:hypothetical protein
MDPVRGLFSLPQSLQKRAFSNRLSIAPSDLEEKREEEHGTYGKKTEYTERKTLKYCGS